MGSTISGSGTDAGALTVRVAHLGIIGDLKTILPKFIEKCRELTQG